MTDLAALSLARAGLPSFAGATLPEQLLTGRDAALAALRKYVPALSFDPGAARTVLDQVNVWIERNQARLTQVLSDPSVEAMPAEVQIALGADKAQQFVIAVFTEAAAGLGPWVSGAVDREAQLGKAVSIAWAQADAEMRLEVFAGIVRMDEDGYLAKLFTPPSAASGFGALPALVVWAVVITVVALAAVVLLYFYNSKRLSENNRLMTDLCTNAQKSGDQATVLACLKAAEGLQQQGMFQGLDDLMRAIGKVVLWGGLAYVVLKVGVPALWEARSRRRAVA
jgi:hypothetical protein